MVKPRWKLKAATEQENEAFLIYNLHTKMQQSTTKVCLMQTKQRSRKTEQVVVIQKMQMRMS